MPTIQLQCGSCRKPMAINVEHLGKQVRCPHCKSVVQTPPPEPKPAPEPEPVVAVHEHTEMESEPETPPSDPPRSWIDSVADQPESEPPPERDSIFEDRKPDDLFDDEPAKVEMPREDAEDLQESGVGAAGDNEPNAFRSMNRREIPKASNFPIYMLIFLIPYSICSTGFIAYLLLNQKNTNTIERFEWLGDVYPDAKGKKDVGTARRISQPPPDAPMPKNLQVSLGETKQIGDVEVTPLKVLVRKNARDEIDLVLQVRAKNVSDDTQFCPISPNFLFDKDRNALSFVYLEEPEGDRRNKFYPAYLDHDHKDAYGILKPGESATYEMKTDVDFRKSAAKFLGPEEKFKESKKELQWRVQVRRGLVKFKEKDVSATALIGVQFSPKDIVPEE